MTILTYDWRTMPTRLLSRVSASQICKLTTIPLMAWLQLISFNWIKAKTSQKVCEVDHGNDQKEPWIFQDLSLIESSPCQIWKFRLKMQWSKTNFQKFMSAFDRVFYCFFGVTCRKHNDKWRWQCKRIISFNLLNFLFNTLAWKSCCWKPFIINHHKS